MFSMTSYLWNWFFQSDVSVAKGEPGDSQQCVDLSSHRPARLSEEEYKQIPQKNSPGLLTQNHADGPSGGTTTVTAEVDQRDAAGGNSGVREEHSSTPGGLREAGVQESELELNPRRLQFILMGKTGTGKSATGNSILGRQEFVSKVSTRPVTTALQRGSREWAGKELQVIDTPDIFSPEFQSGVVVEEIRQLMSSPVPHTVLLVIQLGRFTEQDQQVVKRLQETFGTGILAHTILVFTRVEDLAGDSLDEYVKETSNQNLLELDVLCLRRHCGFNNRARGTEQEQQLQDLMDRSEMILWEQKDHNHTRSACQCSQGNVLLPEMQKREKIQEQGLQEIPDNESSLEGLVPNLEGI